MVFLPGSAPPARQPGRALAQDSGAGAGLTPEQVQEIIKSGQPLFATYTPSGPTTLEESAPLAITNPNILIVCVDQLRAFTTVTQNDPVTQAVVDAYLPNIAALRKNSHVFLKYHVAAAMCTPARSTLLTGLYSRQTFQLLTEGVDGIPALNSAFPTFGTALNDPNVTTAYNNNAWWFGKWHLSGVTPPNPLDQYGFQTRTYPSGTKPSPNGWANEGVNGGLWPPPGCSIPPENCGPGQTPNDYASDQDIVGDFIQWISQPHSSPWCAVVSLINPHDISGYPRWILNYPQLPGGCPSVGKVPNYAPLSAIEAQLYAAGITPQNFEDGLSCLKPHLYYVFKEHKDRSNQPVSDWGSFLNWYFGLQKQVDDLLGNITNPANPATILGAVNQFDSLSNTVVIFTSDHGDYGGAHGLHGKGGGVYQEGIHVPLYVSYPGARLGFAIPRTQLGSSVDFFALVVELATGAGAWRGYYPHLQNRQSLAFYLSNPSAPETRVVPAGGPLAGLPYFLHTTDEIWSSEYEPGGSQYEEYASEQIGCVQPGDPIQNHAACLLTNQAPVSQSNPNPAAKAKLAVYSLWNCLGFPKATEAKQYEFYDYQNKGNALETGNDAPQAPDTPASFCATPPADPTEISFCDHSSALGDVTALGVQSGLMASELNPPLPASLQPAQNAARIAYREYLRTGDPPDCAAPYSPQCPPAS